MGMKCSATVVLPGDVLNKLLYCSSSDDNVGTTHEGISYTLSGECTNKGTAQSSMASSVGSLSTSIAHILALFFLVASYRGTKSWRFRSLASGIEIFTGFDEKSTTILCL